MSFRKIFDEIFSNISNTKDLNNKPTNTNLSTDSEPEKKCQQFYQKWVEDFKNVEHIEIKRLSRSEIENLHQVLIKKNIEFINERQEIKSLNIPLEDKTTMGIRDSDIIRVNQWYENFFIRKLNSVAAYLEKIRSLSETSEERSLSFDAKQSINKEYTPEELQAKSIYDKWMSYFNILSKINIESMSPKEVGRFHEEFNKKSEEYRQDKITYLSNIENIYIQNLGAEIDKKFNDEHAPKIIQLRKIEVFLNLNQLFHEMTEIVPSRNKILSNRSNFRKYETAEYNISLSINEAKNSFIHSIELNNEQLSSELQFNEYVYKRKIEVELKRKTYESLRNNISDIQSESAIKQLIESLDSTFANFEKLPELIQETRNQLTDNKNIMVNFQLQIETLENMQRVYQHAKKTLEQRQLDYEVMVGHYTYHKVNLPELNENLTWDEMFDCMEQIKTNIQIETKYLEDLNDFVAFKTSFKNQSTLEVTINQLNDKLPQVSLDANSVKQIKRIDEDYLSLKNDVSQKIQYSKQKLQHLQSSRDDLKKQMIDLENEHLINGEYQQVRYLKFKAIKQFVLQNEYYNKLKSYGNRADSNKQKEINKYITQIETADNLFELFTFVKADIIHKNKLFSMRQNSTPAYCSIARYGWFHQGQSKSDDYALSLEYDLIRFTQSICKISTNETPVYLSRRFGH